MAMEMRQELKLSQQLVMTPQLQKVIRLLQLSRMELADLVHEEMLENPILDDELDLERERGIGICVGLVITILGFLWSAVSGPEGSIIPVTVIYIVIGIPS